MATVRCRHNTLRISRKGTGNGNAARAVCVRYIRKSAMRHLDPRAGHNPACFKEPAAKRDKSGCRHTFYTVILCCMLLLCPSAGFCADFSAFRSGDGALRGIGSDFTTDPAFSSHLPLLVFEPAAISASGTRGQLLLYGNHEGGGSLQNVPEITLNVLMKADPDQEDSEKKTYVLEHSPLKDGELSEVSLAGLPYDNKWRLRGSSRDKGMLRNGLAYAFGRVLFPGYTPETRYCEVLLKRNSRYYYQGLYILAETVEHMIKSRTAGEKEGVLLEYAPGRNGGQGNSPQDADAAIFGLSLKDRGFSVVQGQSDGNVLLDSRVEMELDRVESILQSLNPGTFLTYRSLLDQGSAIDLFILNALLLNARDSAVPLFLFREADKGLRFLPAWHFDAAIDNVSIRQRPLPFEADIPDISPPSILARRTPVWRQLESGGDIRDLRLYPVYSILDGERFLWFDRLFLSRPFLMEMFARYHQLRRGHLSPARVGQTVDILAENLGPALERDWKRWEKEYAATGGPYALMPYTDSSGETHIRQTYAYDQELVKIRHCLREQDAFLMRQFSQMGWMTADLFDTAVNGNRQAAYALAAMAGFLVLTYMLTRKL